MKRAAAHAVRIGLIQSACSADPAANLKKTLALAERAARRGAHIICTQELFRSQYFCQSEDYANFKLAETIPGPSTEAFCKLAKKHRVVVIASLFEKRAAGLYHNTAAVIDADGALLGIYRKMHIPDDPLYYEKFYFTPGDTGFRAWKTTLRQDRRADLLGPVVSRGRAADRAAGRRDHLLPHRHRLASRAKRPNTANASTTPGKRSSAATPSPTAATSPPQPRRPRKNRRRWAATASNSGARASSPAPAARSSPKRQREQGGDPVVPVDLAQVDDTRTHWPFLRDRRIDAYGDLTKRFVD